MIKKLSDFTLIVFDFDGVFTDNLVSVDENGKESVTCSRADGLGISMLKRSIRKENLSCKLLVLSTEKNSVVAQRCSKLGLECVQGVANKKRYLEENYAISYSNQKSLWESILYFGNDLNDIELMNLCTSFAPADAHSMVKEVASLVFDESGGHGFVRAGIESILSIDTINSEELYELIFDR